MLIDRLNITGKKGYPGPPPNIATVKAIKELADKVNKYDQLNIPLDELTFTILDTETTGFYAHKGDEIISLGAVKMSGTKIMAGEEIHLLVNPYRPIPEQITRLTGICNNMVNDKEDVFKALKEMLGFLGSTILVGHTLGFDLSFINRKLKHFCNTRIHNIIIDTKLIAMGLYPHVSATDLDSLLLRHGIEPQGRHTAIGDAFLTARLFKIFLEEMRKKKIITIKDLFRFLNCSCSHTANNITHAYFNW